jgi:hypothetical protein
LGDEALADVKADFLELGRNQIGWKEMVASKPLNYLR